MRSFPGFQRSINFPTQSGQPIVASSDYASGNGTTDDTSALQTAINLASGQGIALGLTAGTYRITSALSLPDGFKMLGFGGEIVLDTGANFAALDLDGVENVVIDGVRLRCQGSPGGTCYGVHIRGAAKRIIVSRSRASGFGSNYVVRGENGSTPGTSTDVTFSECYGDGALQTYGFECSNCEAITFDGCYARENYLDGFKIRALTQNVRLLSCVARDNGQSPGSAGDGLDAYAGGDSFIVDNFVSENNDGNGMTIKTDIDTRDDPATFGYVRNIQLSNCICRGNYYGIFLATNTQSVNNYYDNPPAFDMATLPQPKQATITNAYIEGNAFQGLYINMVGVTVHGGIYRANGYDGIQIGLRSLWVTLVAPVLVANGQDPTDSGFNIYSRGKHIRIYSPQFFGVDPDIVRTEADLIGTPTALANLSVGSSQSDDVEIFDPVEDPTSEGSITTAATSGRIVFHLSGDGTPESNVRGGIGSTYKQRDATEGRDVLWMKTSGTPATSTGWTRFNPGNIADANSSYGDWAFGALSQALSGVTILGTTLAGVAFVDSAGGLDGALEYSFGSPHTMYFRVAGTRQLRINAAGFFPDSATPSLYLGTDTNRFLRMNAQSLAGEFEDSPVALSFSFYALMDDGESTALASAVGRRGVVYLVEHGGGGAAVTIGRAGGDTINGSAANFTLNAGELALCVSDGTSDWRVKVIG